MKDKQLATLASIFFVGISLVAPTMTGRGFALLLALFWLMALRKLERGNQ